MEPTPPPRSYARLVLSLILIALAVVFVVQNWGVVQVHYLFWTASMSLSLLVFINLLIGIAVGWLWHGHSSRRRLYQEVARSRTPPRPPV